MSPYCSSDFLSQPSSLMASHYWSDDSTHRWSAGPPCARPQPAAWSGDVIRYSPLVSWATLCSASAWSGDVIQYSPLVSWATLCSASAWSGDVIQYSPLVSWATLCSASASRLVW